MTEPTESGGCLVALGIAVVAIGISTLYGLPAAIISVGVVLMLAGMVIAASKE